MTARHTFAHLALSMSLGLQLEQVSQAKAGSSQSAFPLDPIGFHTAAIRIGQLQDHDAYRKMARHDDGREESRVNEFCD
jgi:hypothetical protein